MAQGLFGGVTFGAPTSIGGVGAGLYIDSYGNLYPQAYYGTPKLGGSVGYTSDLEGYLTGPSVSGSIGNGTLKYNFGRSGDSNGVGFGTPGIGFTYGFGPYNVERFYRNKPSFDDRYGRWGSSPVGPGPEPDGSSLFDRRFGQWVNEPAGDLGEPVSPVLRELRKYLKAMTPDAARPASRGEAVPRAQDATRSPESGGSFVNRFGNWSASSPDDAVSSPLGEPPPQGAPKLIMDYVRRRNEQAAGQSPDSVFEAGAPAIPFIPDDSDGPFGGRYGDRSSIRRLSSRFDRR